MEIKLLADFYLGITFLWIYFQHLGSIWEAFGKHLGKAVVIAFGDRLPKMKVDIKYMKADEACNKYIEGYVFVELEVGLVKV